MTSPATASRTDLTYEIVYNSEFIPVKSSEASVKTSHEGPETSYIIRIGQQEYGAAQFYQLDEASKLVWDLIDGHRTVGRIIKEASASGKTSTPDDAIGALLFFAESGALRSKNDPVVWKRVRIASSFMAQIAIIRDSTKLLGSVHKFLRPILRGSLFWASMIIVLVGVAVYAPRFNSIFSDARNFQVLGSAVVGFLFYNFVILAPVIVIHELAHGLALYHYSGQSGEVGTGLFYFGPMFYVDTTGYWSLNRRQRIMIMWAGNLSTLLIGALMVLAQLVFPLSPSVSQTLDVAAFWCFYGTLWNLAPPFETDGYYILADLVNMPNLRPDALSYLKSLILRVFRRPAEQLERLTPRKKRVLIGYSIFSISALSYIAFQSLRFTTYMAGDAAQWATRIGASLTIGDGAMYAVGLTSIGYFAMTITGYGVLVSNQIRKSLIRGLRFEAVHDRDLAVFFYIPKRLPGYITKRLENRIRNVARDITTNFSIGRRGALLYANLRIGSATLPLSQIKTHLRSIEQKFYQAYSASLAWNRGGSIRGLTTVGINGRPLSKLLSEIANNSHLGEKDDLKQSLKEYVRRQEKSIGYLLGSSFSTAWTVEVPPAQQYELLDSLLPGILLQDLTMTNLAGGREEFKKYYIYGLDTIAELAREASQSREAILSNPDRSQLVALFEPVRGRIIFVGRTERVEKHLAELGTLFTIQVWSGYTDSLLSSTNLSLYAIAESLPAVPEGLAIPSDGELNSLDRYVTELRKLEANVVDALARSEQALRPSRQWLKQLKMLLLPNKKMEIEMFSSVLRLNAENLRSVPVRLKDCRAMTKACFNWVKTLEARVDSEQERRQTRHLARTRRFTRSYLVTVPLSVVLALLGLPRLASLAGQAMLTASILLQLAHATLYYLFRRSTKTAPRHPSDLFLQILTPIYALTQTLGSFVVGANALNPLEIESETGREEKGEPPVIEEADSLLTEQLSSEQQLPSEP